MSYLVYVINTIFNNVEVVSVITLCNNFLSRFCWEFEHCIQYGVELFALQTKKLLWFLFNGNGPKKTRIRVKVTYKVVGSECNWGNNAHKVGLTYLLTWNQK